MENKASLNTPMFSLRNLLLYTLLFALSFSIYYQSLGFGYVLDDVIVYTENSFVQKGIKGIWNIFSKESFTGYFGEQKDLVAGSRYRPLSIVSFALEFEFFGNKPGLSHFINILLYGLTGCVLLRLFSLLFSAKWQSPWFFSLPFLAALLFISHPIHSEAVANIKGRDEIMSLLFSLSAFVSWMRFVDTNKKTHLILSVFWFLLGLFSKENAITFVAVIPLGVYFFRDVPLANAVRTSWPLIAGALFFIIVRTKVIGYVLSSGVVITDLMNNPFIGMRADEKFASIFYTIIWYYKLLLFPHPLTHDYYPYHVPKSEWTDLIPIAALLVTAALFYLAYRFRSSNKVVSFGILYYFITFSIVSNLVFPVGTFMNERFLYMPSAGFSMLTAYGIHFGYQSLVPKWKWLPVLFVLALLSAYSFKTIDRVPDWKDGFSLNLSAVKVSKNSARINLFTGVSYFQKFQVEENQEKKYQYLTLAEDYIDRSLKIFPDYGQALNMKAGVLSEWLKKDNNVQSFLQKLESIIRIKPDLDFVTKYMEYLTKDPSNNNFMIPYLKRIGYEILYKEKQNYQFALHFLGMAYKLQNQDADLCYYIAVVYRDFAKFGNLKSQKIQEYENNSKNFFQQAAALDPKYAK